MKGLPEVEEHIQYMSLQARRCKATGTKGKQDYLGTDSRKTGIQMIEIFNK
jgi:hypothetical protein